jgi:chromate transporter
MKPLDIYITLLGQFALLSILAIGGANAVVPEIHRLSVHDQHWMTDTQFVDLFALAQAAPGPNVLVVSLIGLQVGGLLGALITTLAMCGPSSILAYTISNAWDRFRERPWRKATQAGLAPVTIGLVLGSGWILTDAADHSWVAYAITAASAALTLFTRIHPLWLLAAAGAVGLAGLV